MNNLSCKLIQGATTTRKQPGSSPKRPQRESFSVPPNMRRSHFTKGKPSYPRYQPTVTPLKPVLEEPAFYISKVTVRVFSEKRIIRLFIIRSASRRNPLKLSAKAIKVTLRYFCVFLQIQLAGNRREISPEKVRTSRGLSIRLAYLKIISNFCTKTIAHFKVKIKL